MRKFAAVFALALLPLATARAQSCPGVAPWVFVDVAASHAFCTYVTWMAQNNVTLGCRIIDASNREYCPDDFVTRLQMAAFMNRLGNALFPLSCAAGQVMKWNGAAWTCADDSLGGSGGGGTVTSVLAGTGLSASPNPITGAGSINLAASYRLPQACAVNQVPKWIGGVWTCANDVDTNAGGTVTSLSQGVGILLTPNPVTTTGTLAADTAYLQRRVSVGCAAGSSIRAIAADGSVTCETDDAGPANAFVRDGNAFGGEAVLGTTDIFALDVRVNNSRVMRYEPNAISPNVIGGSPANNVTAGVRGATIAGGGMPAADVDPQFVGEAPNIVTDAFGTVSGGFGNRAGNDSGTPADAVLATVSGGYRNVAEGSYSTVGGGDRNVASALYAVVSGGFDNQATGRYAIAAGGERNRATGWLSTVAGGAQGDAAGVGAAVGGGGARGCGVGCTSYAPNVASGNAATVPGGFGNLASGDFSFAAGRGSQANGNYSFALGNRAVAASGPSPAHGAFVYADSNDFAFSEDVPNSFAVRATGGIRFVTQVDGAGIPTRTTRLNSNGELEFWSDTRQMLNLWGPATYGIGVQAFTLYFRTDGGYSWYRGGSHSNTQNDSGPGGTELMRLQSNGTLLVTGGTVGTLSDRAAKRDFAPVDPAQVLDKVVGLPLAEWSYDLNPQARHIGPTSQDFRAAFGLGDDDRTIATVDTDGVTLAAIQGLNAKLEARLAEQGREIADLRRVVEELLARR